MQNANFNKLHIHLDSIPEHPTETVGKFLARFFRQNDIREFNKLIGTRDLERHTKLSRSVQRNLRKVIDNADEFYLHFQKTLWNKQEEAQAGKNKTLKKYKSIRHLLPHYKRYSEKTVLNFFDVDNENSIQQLADHCSEKYYEHQSGDLDSIGLAGMYRYAEIVFSKSDIDIPFRRESLKKWIESKEWASHLNDLDYLLNKIPVLMKKIGLCVVFIPQIRNTVQTFTTWINDLPVIAITDIYKNLDVCWLNLFHSFYHVLNNPSQTFFCNRVGYFTNSESIIEWGANNFLENILFSNGKIREYLYALKAKGKEMSEKPYDIKKLSSKFKIDPYILGPWLRKFDKDHLAHYSEWMVKVDFKELEVVKNNYDSWSNFDSRPYSEDFNEFERFRNKIDEAMKHNHIKQKELAKSLNVSPGFISQILNGSRNPGIEQMKRIANVCGLQLSLVYEQSTDLFEDMADDYSVVWPYVYQF